MALGRTLVSNYRLIAKSDASLDREHTDDQGKRDFDHLYRLYLDDGDESHLPVLGNDEPVRWELRHLPQQIVGRLQDLFSKGSANEAFLVAVKYALVEVHGMKLPDGAEAKVEHTRDAAGFPVVVEADLASLREAGLIGELGDVILQRAFPDPKS